MITIRTQQTLYHGWQIDIVEWEEGFSFQCYQPHCPNFCNDASTHITSKAALVAACYFVDREIAILSLIDQIADWYETDKISEEEYWNLTNFE